MHGGAAVGETGAAEEALQVAENEEAGKVVDEGGGYGEDDEEGEGRDVDGVAADDGDFAKRGEEERAHAVWESRSVNVGFLVGRGETYRPGRKETREEKNLWC